MNPGRPIVITGFMGCGKTEVARRLGLRLQLPMIDLDHEIAARQRRSAAQLIIDKGEAAFRIIETATLRELLGRGISCVIALGGGAWITEANRKLIKEHDGLAVWLDTPFKLCWQRIQASPEVRPLAHNRGHAEQLYRSRQPVYQLATIRVPVMAHEPLESLMDRLEAQLKNHRHAN